MRRVAVLAIAAIALAACSRSRKKEEIETSERAVRPGTPAVSAGSAGSGTTMTPATPTPAADPAKRVAECWGFRSDGKWDELKACYAPDATLELVGAPIPPYHGADAIVDAAKGVRATFPDERGEPFVTLVDKQHVTVLLVHTGTFTGKDPTGRLKATGKKFGDLVGQVIELDDQGRARQIQEYFDLGTLFGQIDPKKDHPVRDAIDKAPIDKVAATTHGDDAEKANLAVIAKLGAAFDAHDDKAIAELVADDVVWSEQVQPKDWTKAQLVGNLPKLWKAFPELKTTIVSQSAAGDFVATIQSTKLDKATPAQSMLVVFQVKGGKITRTWSLFQSQAPAAKK